MAKTGWSIARFGLLIMASCGWVPAQNGWPPPSPHCHYIGNSACGDQAHSCAPQERYLSQKCDDGRVIDACGKDDYCASVNKGRVWVGGAWSGGYVITQNQDTLSCDGPFGHATGQFTGPYSFVMRWKTATWTAQYNTQDHKLYWNNNTSWHR